MYRFYRTLVRVNELRGKEVNLTIPGWSKESFDYPKSLIPSDFCEVGARFFAFVNLNATSWKQIILVHPMTLAPKLDELDEL
ncbi:MAG: hypothetical protein AAF316_00150 [Cyanobacteria bacterium P01_A01_bin.80]